MRELIYFPGFEIADVNWLKFALLYLDCLRPIVPKQLIGTTPIVHEYMRAAIDDTDLIRYYSPNTRQIATASSDVMHYLMHIIYNKDNPDREHIINEWRRPQNQIVKISREKLSAIFAKVCVGEGLATKVDGGLLMSKELSFAYMGILASSIAEDAEIDMITDNFRQAEHVQGADLFSARYKDYEINLARSEIEFLLPQELERIPLNDIISLRNQSSFSAIRSAYMQQVQRIVDQQRNGCFVDIQSEMRYIHAEIADVLMKVLKIAAPIALTVVGLYSLTSEQTFSGLVEAGVGSFQSANSIPDELQNLTNSLKSLKQKHYCRKYVAELSNFSQLVR